MFKGPTVGLGVGVGVSVKVTVGVEFELIEIVGEMEVSALLEACAVGVGLMLVVDIFLFDLK